LAEQPGRSAPYPPLGLVGLGVDTGLDDRAVKEAGPAVDVVDGIAVVAPARVVVPETETKAASRRATIRERDTTVRRLLGVADGFAVTIALIASAIAVGGDTLTWAALAVPPLFVLLAKAMGLYDRDAQLLHKTTLDEFPKALGLATMTTLLLWLADGALIEGEIGREQVLACWGLLLVGMIAFRGAARAIAVRATPVERCLFVGDAASAEEFREKLTLSHSVHAELVGWLPASSGLDGAGDSSGQSSLPERIRSLIAERDVHRIVLGPGASDDELLDSVRRIKDNEVKVSVLPNVARLVNASVELDRLNGITLLGLRRFEITLSSRMIKRTFDLVGSALALVVVAPVLAATAIAIRLDSRGPILFRQTRAGRHGESFEMLKFRSMVDGAEEQKEDLRHLNEAQGVFKIANDPRITRVGALIRASHLDELPQLLNVLKGEMSLVGPRPLPLDEDRRIEGWHRRRLDLSPGITGPWQILGSARIPVREMVKLDYQYVADWSLWNDIRILFLTIGHVASRRGQ
jgi:exopolysaccharide biosynthesis polyprenyl glycosylphosphotransferase